ncbi:uncharacterized protein BDW43DRAFT_258513 [Aspergillus alliaceus]|uniref:uncharacterized protein n=1 Tax=Petromyces alliaceus TaxID=209559 RepID=UPI0012A4C077|nr:uncharacterized protein BDW43DRAFT_258513 [Aspergillus alliaceus]KAB8239577.1 hypothetical protein BDW43DRAFT_258513 [Aspergillus alliaceus]
MCTPVYDSIPGKSDKRFGRKYAGCTLAVYTLLHIGVSVSKHADPTWVIQLCGILSKATGKESNR